MSVVKTSGLVDGIKGKIGGDVFQYTAGGLTFRGGKTCKRVTTWGAASQQSMWPSLTGYWRKLSATQRNSFITSDTRYQSFTKWGVARQPSPYNLFVKLNGTLLYLNLPFVTTLPSYVAATSQSGSHFVASHITNLRISPGGSCATHELLMVETTRACSAGISNPTGQWRVIYVAYFVLPGAFSLLDYYEPVWEALKAGLAFWARLSTINTQTGIRSAKTIISTILLA